MRPLRGISEGQRIADLSRTVFFSPLLVSKPTVFPTTPSSSSSCLPLSGATIPLKSYDYRTLAF